MEESEFFTQIELAWLNPIEIPHIKDRFKAISAKALVTSDTDTIPVSPRESGSAASDRQIPSCAF
jgi:hypothetical protein